MNNGLRAGLWAFAAGLVFGAGLVVSGMGNPHNVHAFLDFAGDWDPRLMFVMAGAIAAHAPVYRWVRKLASPWAGPRFVIPTRRDIDAKLLIGSGVFGLGWGIAGWCPGPSVVALPSGQLGVLAFLAAMVVGLSLPRLFERKADPGPGPGTDAERSASV